MSSLRVAALLSAFVFAGCNCGKSNGLQKTESSLTLASDVLDFGPVIEGTSQSGRLRIDNNGRAPVGITLTLRAGSSADFTLGPAVTAVDGLGFVEQLVTFTPAGPAEDEGFVDITTDNPDELPLTVRLHGGPIFAALEFDPDPLDFKPATQLLETKTVRLRSAGGASLEVKNIGVSPSGSPDFSIVPTMTPRTLLPGETMSVQVEYARSPNLTEGLMEVNCNDADAGVRRLRLLPDRPPACSDSIDNDLDGKIDFPADPGCDNLADDDEANSGACVSGATRVCGSGLCLGTQACLTTNTWDMCMADAGAAMPETCNNVDDDCDGQVDDNLDRVCYSAAVGTQNVGRCRDGMQTCAAGSWGTTCPGEVVPAAMETCGNGVDDDCDGPIDEGCPTDAGTADAGTFDAGCTPTGLYRVDGGALTYTCCLGLVNVNISQLQLQSGPGGAVVTPGTYSNPDPMVSTAPLACGVSFDVQDVYSGGCTETYRLQGTWTSATSFGGTFTAQYSGADCSSGLCTFGGGLPCTNQSWSFTASK